MKLTSSRRSFLKNGSLAAAASALVLTNLNGCQPENKALKKPGQTPNTKFAVNIEIWWKDLPVLDRLEKTAELGFPGIEFWSYADKDLDAMAAKCQELGLSIRQFTAWGFEPGMNNPANHDLFEEKIKEAIQVAKKLNCPKATVVGGNDQEGMSREEMHENIITALKRVKPLVEEAGLMLILEPMNIRVDHKGHSLYGSPDAVRICREVNSPMVKINWDLYHMHISEGDLCGHLNEGFDQVGYIQVADHPGRKEPGTGEIYYPRVFKELKTLGYDGYVGLECWPLEGELAAAARVAQADKW
ncbi:hydroxypyruvate isomerase family protein [Gaoshiqia sediminis]|uniref:TIM barrel protein n=1 Tax=Gaoshiqia sediminis TaxID=2986998 RepID=A0AA42C5M3_9BACT|nr:TIM barrel protein [Gaoshiqia sediminis]MCW0483003.1 TIM barrel protein [Gaoshiqia sediminis]